MEEMSLLDYQLMYGSYMYESKLQAKANKQSNKSKGNKHTQSWDLG